MNEKGICYNTGRTHFKKGQIPWNIGKHYHFKTKREKITFSEERKKNFSKIAREKGFGLWMIGKKHTEDTKAKMSLLAKQRGFGQWMVGKKHLKETKIKISQAQKRIVLEGKHNFWQGGISYLSYSSLFNKQLKEKIRVRDNFKCQLCGIPELELLERLHIHHINYDKKDCQKENLISLCRKCHVKTNGNRNYWIDFLKKRINIYAERT